MTNLSFVRQVTAAALSVLLCSNLWAASSDTLAPRQRAIVAIAAHTANGDLNAQDAIWSKDCRQGSRSTKSRKCSFSSMPTPGSRAVSTPFTRSCA